MIRIAQSLTVDEREVQITFVRSSGPGGQNVNKVATAVQLRFDVRHSPSLPEGVRARLTKLAGKRVTARGVLLIDARRYRTQEQNRQDALGRFVALVRRSVERPRTRKPTSPNAASRQRRLEGKHRQGATKKLRQTRSLPDE